LIFGGLFWKRPPGGMFEGKKRGPTPSPHRGGGERVLGATHGGVTPEKRTFFQTGGTFVPAHGFFVIGGGMWKQNKKKPERGGPDGVWQGWGKGICSFQWGGGRGKGPGGGQTRANRAKRIGGATLFPRVGGGGRAPGGCPPLLGQNRGLLICQGGGPNGGRKGGVFGGGGRGQQKPLVGQETRELGPFPA